MLFAFCRILCHSKSGSKARLIVDNYHYLSFNISHIVILNYCIVRNNTVKGIVHITKLMRIHKNNIYIYLYMYYTKCNYLLQILSHEISSKQSLRSYMLCEKYIYMKVLKISTLKLILTIKVIKYILIFIKGLIKKGI